LQRCRNWKGHLDPMASDSCSSFALGDGVQASAFVTADPLNAESSMLLMKWHWKVVDGRAILIPCSVQHTEGGIVSL